MDEPKKCSKLKKPDTKRPETSRIGKFEQTGGRLLAAGDRPGETAAYGEGSVPPAS